MQLNFFLLWCYQDNSTIILYYYFLILSYFSAKGISPDVITYTTLMKAFIRAKKFDKVLIYPLTKLIFGLDPNL